MTRRPTLRISGARAVLVALVAVTLSLAAETASTADESETDISVTVPAVQRGPGVDPPTDPPAEPPAGGEVGPARAQMPPTGLPSWVAPLGWVGVGLVGAGALTLTLSRVGTAPAGVTRGTATRKVVR